MPRLHRSWQGLRPSRLSRSRRRQRRQRNHHHGVAQKLSTEILIIPTSGHLQHPAQQTQRIVGTQRPHERVPGSCTFATYAVAFLRCRAPSALPQAHVWVGTALLLAPSRAVGSRYTGEHYIAPLLNMLPPLDGLVEARLPLTILSEIPELLRASRIIPTGGRSEASFHLPHYLNPRSLFCFFKSFPL